MVAYAAIRSSCLCSPPSLVRQTRRRPAGFGSDPWRWFVYDERWRVIAAYRGTDESVESDAKERFVYHAAGSRSSGSYIDDLVLRDRDAVQPEADPANTDPAETWLFESDGVVDSDDTRA